MTLLKCYIKILTKKLTAKTMTYDKHMLMKWEDREFHHHSTANKSGLFIRNN